MSLLILMYHRARTGRHGNAPAMLDAHFAHIARHYRTLLPGDLLKKNELNLCLTFDDAYYDFYETVYPLLKKNGLRALLAVPTFYPGETVGHSPRERLALTTDQAFAHPDKGGFCRWDELQEMAVSGHVGIAAHGCMHVRLDQPGTDFSAEIESPKTLLESRLKQPVGSFVFPYGRYSKAALDRVKAHYPYAFRIGGAINHSWDAPVLYRVDADGMENPTALFSPQRRAGYHARYYWNRLRGR